MNITTQTDTEISNLIPHYQSHRRQFSLWNKFEVITESRNTLLRTTKKICDFFSTILTGAAFLNSTSVFCNRERDFTCSVWKWYLMHMNFVKRQSIKLNHISYEILCRNKRCEWRLCQCGTQYALQRIKLYFVNIRHCTEVPFTQNDVILLICVQHVVVVCCFCSSGAFRN
jgi:hypothetical protein